MTSTHPLGYFYEMALGGLREAAETERPEKCYDCGHAPSMHNDLGYCRSKNASGQCMCGGWVDGVMVDRLALRRILARLDALETGVAAT